MNYTLPITAVLLCFYVIVGSEEVVDNDASQTDDTALHRVRRAGLSMLRLGRGLQMLRLGKRALPMLRLGRSTPPGLSDEDLQYILSLMRNGRTVPLPRYGRELPLEILLMNALKNAERNSEMYDDDDEPEYEYGYDLGTAPERHIRPAPRPGMRYRRSADTDSMLPEVAMGAQGADKGLTDRVAPMMRYGKELPSRSQYDAYSYDDQDEAVVKRAMRMLRLGRGMRMLRLGKRPMESTSAEASDEDYTEADKRALRLLRLGKRPFKMLRLGRSDNNAGEEEEEEEEKRAAFRLLRLGRAAPSEQS